jgi:hypothetical protein
VMTTTSVKPSTKSHFSPAEKVLLFKFLPRLSLMACPSVPKIWQRRVGSVALTLSPSVRVTESKGPTIPPRATWLSGKLSAKKVVGPPRVELLTSTTTELGSMACLATSSFAVAGMANAPVAARAAKRTDVYMFVLVAVVRVDEEFWLISL